MKNCVVIGLLASIMAVSASAQAVSPTADQVALRQLLVEHRFEQLEQAFAANAAAMRVDIGKEVDLAESIGAFEYPDSTLRPHLDAWIATRPSAVSYAVRASYALGMGWAARGEESAGKTSDEQFASLRDWLKLAGNDAITALERDSTAVMAYWVFQRVLWHVGTPQLRRAVVDKALRFAPGSFVTRANYLHALRPRWGGSFEEMRAFAEESQRYATLNPRLHALLGFVAYDEGETLATADSDAAALRKYTVALSYGDYWQFRLKRARVLYSLDREGDAIRDCNAVLAQQPQNATALAWRALSYWFAAKRFPPEQRAAYVTRARADIDRAMRIDPYDSDVQFARKELAVLVADR